MPPRQAAFFGKLFGFDAETGKLAWKFYVVPGDPAKGFEDEALARAARTWNGQWWKAGGGGTPWDGIAYDPELNLIYVGTGNGSPWNAQHRSPGGGDNLYLASRNLPNVLVLETRYADPLSLVHYKKVLVTKAAMDQLKEMFA